jgi:hypothetical protein
LGTNPRIIARDVSAYIRKALEWFRHIALEPKKRQAAFNGASYGEKTTILRVCDHVCREGEDMVLAIADVETPESTSRASTHAFSRSSSNISLESNELASFDALIDEALGGLIASTVVQPDMIAAPSPPLALAKIDSPEHRLSLPPPPSAYFGFPGSSRVSVESRMSFDELLEDVIKDAEVPLTGGSGAIQRSLTVSAANAAKALKLKKDPTTPKATCKAIASKKAEQDKDPTTPKSKCKASASKNSEQETGDPGQGPEAEEGSDDA